MSNQSRVSFAIPQDYVVPRPKTPEPPPFPGTVSAEDLKPPEDPPRPFLVPWSTHTNASRAASESGSAIPVEVDPAKLASFLERYDVSPTLAAVFKDSEDRSIIDHVMRSMANPFRSNGTDIVWTLVRRVMPNPSADDRLGGKKLKNRHKVLRGPAWSIVSFVDPETGIVRRNMIYNGDGDAIVQVDFGHGQTTGIHCHALVQGNLAHTASSTEDHLFPMYDVPWMWLCVPWQGRGGVSRPADLPPTVDAIEYAIVSLPFEDFSDMAGSERTESF
jgi:hypothetical protein